MELELRPDVDAVLERWDGFWRGENKRPLVYATRPRDGVEPVERPNQYSFTFGDVEALSDQVLRWAASMEFLGDAIPFYQVSLAADHFAALLGAEMRQHPDSAETIWVEPFVQDWDAAELRFRPDGRWWEHTVTCMRAMRKRCDGRMLVAGTHVQGGLDAVAAVRGSQQLLFDMVDAPEKVHRALAAVDRAVDEVRDALEIELGTDVSGSINRFGLYCRGRIDVPQCDFSCMIGREMFDEFQLPAFRREVAKLDHSIYHLDGPDAIQHLESLCSVPELDMIQWQPGAGRHDMDWSDLYARIDRLGKGLFWHGGGEGRTQTVREHWDRYGTRMQYWSLYGMTREEIDAFTGEADG